MALDIKTPDSFEIDRALKEFEMKSGVGQQQTDSEIPKPPKTSDNFEIDQALREFEEKSSGEEQQKTIQILKTADDAPKMVQFVIKYSGGMIKDKRTAEYVLSGFAIVIFAVSLYLFFGPN